jgi:hypothetical protein
MAVLLPGAKHLDGIISYLTRTHGGNVHDKGVVTITSKSPWKDKYSFEVRYVADLTSDSCFISGDGPDEWICWDFTKMRVRVTHYAYRAYFMSSWVIHGSLDGINWTEIDHRTDVEELGDSEVASFPVSSFGEFRFIRLTKKGGSHSYLSMRAFEFFGVLFD